MTSKKEPFTQEPVRAGNSLVEKGLQRLCSLYPGIAAISLEQELIVMLKDVLKVILDVLDLKLAWIGLVSEGSYDVKPVASAGFETGYLKSLKVTWDDSEFGNGPTGQAIKSLRPVVQNNVDTEPSYAPWREEARQRGYRSCAAFPILAFSGRCLGTLNLYSPKPEFFNEKTTQDIQTLLTIALSAAMYSMHVDRFKRIAESSFSTLYDLYENAPVMYVAIDTDGIITNVNKTMAEALGYVKEELVGKPVTTLLTEASVKAREASQPTLLTTGELRGVERQLVRKDGSVIDVMLDVTIQYGADGKHLYSRAVLRDITAQKQVKAQIRSLVYRLNDIAPGGCYFSESRERSIRVFVALTKILPDIRGLCIIRESPEDLIKDYDLKAEQIMLLSSTPVKEFKTLSDLQAVSLAISEFLKAGGVVVLLSGLEYLITRFGFNSVYMLLQEKRFQVLEANAILLVALNLDALNSQERALILSELKTLK